MLLPTKRRVDRRNQRNQRAAALRPRRLAVEPLEPRRLLAADGVIAGVKWLDADGDGQRSADEPGLPGVTIYSDANLNGRFDDGEPNAVTVEDDPNTRVDEAGRYRLENLKPGRHVIREVVPDGFEQTFPLSLVGPAGHADDLPDREFFTVHPEQIDMHLEAGESFRTRVSLTIHPFCFRPYRVDVVATDPDVKFENHTGIVLNGCGGDTSSFAVSMVGDGQTHVFDLQFIDTEISNSVIGVIPVQIGAESPGGAHLVRLEAGDTVEGINFGNRPIEVEPASIHGVKWNDENGNGHRDSSESGLPGVTIYSDANLNGQFDDGEPRTVSMEDDPNTRHDEAGMYWLENLKPGRHVIREVVPDGFRQTFPGSLVGPAGHADDLPGNDLFTVHPEQIDADLEAGERFRTHVSLTIHPFCFRPYDVDVVATDPDVKFENHTGIVVNGCGGDTSSFAVSMVGDGQPHLFDLQFIDTKFGNGVIAVIPVQISADLSGGAHLVRLDAGDVVKGIDFGNQPIRDEPGEIHGFKFLDRNGDGERQRDEPGLAGVTIYVDLNNNGELDEQEPQMITTGGDPFPGGPIFEPGHYGFVGLQPDTYVIREVVPDGFKQTFPMSDGGAHKVELQSGDDVRGIDFGNGRLFDPASIHGMKFLDENGNGRQDDDEPGLGGVTIFLDLNDDAILNRGEPATTTLGIGPLPLDPNMPDLSIGDYWFLDLKPGQYVVREVVPDGWRQTFPHEAAHVVQAGSGQRVTGIDFGNRPVSGPPEDLTADGWVDFKDLTILLANWNRHGTELDGNLVEPGSTPVDFADLTALLAAWTGSGGAASPQAAVGGSRLAATQETLTNADSTVSESNAPRQAAAYYFDRLGRREALRDRTGSALRRLQSAAVDRAIETSDELAPRRSRVARRR